MRHKKAATRLVAAFQYKMFSNDTVVELLRSIPDGIPLENRDQKTAQRANRKTATKSLQRAQSTLL